MNGQDNFTYGQAYNYNNQPVGNYSPMGVPPQQVYPQGYQTGYHQPYSQGYPSPYYQQGQAPVFRPQSVNQPPKEQAKPEETDILNLKTQTPVVPRIYKPMSVLRFFIYTLLFSIPLLGFGAIITTLATSKNKQCKVMGISYIFINLIYCAITAFAVYLYTKGMISFKL